MAQAVPNPPGDKKRVKVYELRNNDWFDRGTGFCSAAFIFNETSRMEEPRVMVQSEDTPDRNILKTRICKEDGFQKQQDTLIIWTEPTTGIDMALSFQESEGCAAIWKFVSNVQQQLLAVGGQDDALSDDIPVDSYAPSVALPSPALGNLMEVQSQMNVFTHTPSGRDALAKYILSENYILKLIPLVEMAEDLEDLPSLHRLCNIMKTTILLNDTHIIEYAVTDDLVLGVVGALEYDPDFPSHKANHRHWLGKEGRYKEVVRINEELVRKKIHMTYRLQYLKDVVLARILDDSTFTVLNSLIFYNQVEVVQHLQMDPAFLKELFAVFSAQETDQERKKEAVLFIQQCCALSKNLQQPAVQQLFNNFLSHGLLSVINFGLRHNDVMVRVGATDILVALLDHDPPKVRQTIFRQINERQTPLTDTLIDLLLVELDLGVMSQVADVIKIILDPRAQSAPLENLNKNGGDYVGRMKPQPDPQQATFVKDFYDESAKRLFKPLVDLKDRDNLDFSAQQVSLFIHLIEILGFFVCQHTHHSKYFMLSEKLGERIAQLLQSSEKYLKLSAVKFFRQLINLQDEFYNQQMTQGKLFEPVIDLLIETMSRDNLLNSTCLEFFDFIKRENIKTLIIHIVENYREKLTKVTYVDIFSNFILRYDQTSGFAPSVETSFLDTEDDTPKRPDPTKGNRWDSGIKDMDAAEEEYFNTSDDEEESTDKALTERLNGDSQASKPLVDYTSDEENENAAKEISADDVGEGDRTPDSSISKDSVDIVLTPTSSAAPTPPERLSEKRRREEDEEDDMSKLATQPKRRNSSTSATSNVGNVLRRKKSFNNSSHGNNSGGKGSKIAISISPAIKTGGDEKGEDGN